MNLNKDNGITVETLSQLGPVPWNILLHNLLPKGRKLHVNVPNLCENLESNLGNKLRIHNLQIKKVFSLETSRYKIVRYVPR